MNLENEKKDNELHFAARSISYGKEKKNYFTKICRGKFGVQQILNDCDIYLPPRSLVAIMGPSGAGKTTLLNYLSGRLFMSNYNNGIIKGEILINGELQNFNSIQKRSSYVMQRDCLLDYLTVEETLTFAANFTLKNMSLSMRKKRVNEIISDLKLNKCRKNYIGGEMSKGISGGELKRTCIGIALLQNPSLIFLDEPLSGLDSALAIDVLKILSRLTMEGHTIICTLHQPSSHIFAMFHHFILLNQGEVVYQGSPLQVCDYFENLGYRCPLHFNPADFVLSLIVPKTEEEDNNNNNVEYTNGNNTQEVNGRSYVSLNVDLSKCGEVLNNVCEKKNFNKEELSNEICLDILEDKCYRLTKNEMAKLPNIYKYSEEAKKIRKGMECCYKNLTVDISEECLKKNNCKNEVNKCRFIERFNFSWLRDVNLICRRCTINSLRNPMISWISIFVHLILAVVLGGIWFQLRDGTGQPTKVLNVVLKGGASAVTESAKLMASDFRNTCGALFLVSTIFGFSALTAVVSFLKERVIFNRETANKMYSPSAYFVGKIMSDFFFQHIPATLFLIIFYLMVGFNHSIFVFFRFLATGNLTVFAACGLFYLIGAMVHNIELANFIGPIILVLCMLIAGFFMNVIDLPFWISWLQHLSFIKHSFAAFAVNQFPPMEKFGFLHNYQWLQALGIIEHRIYFSMLILFVLGIGQRIIAFIFLKYANRTLGLEL